MRTTGFLIAAVAVVSTLSASGMAGAQDRPARLKRVYHVAAVAPPPLVVKKRSFLDPGNVVPVGTDNTYLTSNTVDHQPIYESFAPSRFGESTLPQRFDLPYNPRFNAGFGDGLF